MSLPDGYEAVDVGDTSAFAAPEAVAWVRDTLAVGATLFDGARSGAEAEVLGGRGGGAIAVPVPTAEEPGRHWVVRHYRRGGRVAVYLDDRYLALGAARPYAELAVSHAARARGVATPLVVAGAVYRAGAFYQADLVTRRVPGAVELDRVAFGDGVPCSPSAALRLAGALVRQLEEARLVHVDLNARNVLLAPAAAGLGAWVIDLDRCRLLERAAPRPEGLMLARLERSLAKLARSRGRVLDSAATAALRAGYGLP